MAYPPHPQTPPAEAILTASQQAALAKLAEEYLRHTAGSEANGQAGPPDPASSPSPTAPGRAAEQGDGVADHPAWETLKHLTVTITVRLGRAWLPLEDVLSLTRGSVVPLDVGHSQPVDVLVSDMLVARGEVVVVREHFGVRITEIVRPQHP